MEHTLRTGSAEWDACLQEEYRKPYYAALCQKVQAAYAGEAPVFPPQEELFTAFRLTPPSSVRCVIFGQDPYHEPGQAHGLSFSVKEGVKLPPSLRNIFKEIEADTGAPCAQNGNLTYLAEQGVLLLNTVLTVEQGKANSHKNYGWQTFTAAAARALNAQPQPIAYILWGAHAQAMKSTIENAAGPRLVLEGVHPSPLSAYRGFFGSKPFSQVNEFLQSHGETPIHWGNEEEYQQLSLL